MNIKEAKQEIEHTVKAYLLKDENGKYVIPSIRQRPILLMGPPGIGKTQIMEQIAKEEGIGLVAYTITHHTRQSAVGLPYIKEEEFDGKTYSVTEYTLSEIIASVHQERKRSGKKEGILFIDEINCVSETLAPTMLQFLQCKQFGNQSVPEGWIIVAAGNPPEYNKSVREFDMVTLDRVRCIPVEADYGVWKEYAYEQKVHPALLSYLELRPNNFYRVEADVDGLQFVTARGWEDFSNLLTAYQKLDIAVDEEIVYQFLRHHDVAEDVAAYLELYQKYKDDYGIPLILQGRVKREVYQRLVTAGFDERFSVVSLLLDGLMGYFTDYVEEKEVTDQWFAFLKEYKQRLEMISDGKKAYEVLLEEKRQEALYPKWKAWTPEHTGSAKESFSYARKGFEEQRNQLAAKEKEANEALACAFRFMEEAFQEGQEMVIFVTELSLHKESAQYLAQHYNEKYAMYNQELLIGDKRRELLAEIEDVANQGSLR